MLVAMHILALHEVGSNNPDGIDIKSTRTRTAGRWMRWHSTYFTVKDMIGVAGFLFFFCAIIFFKPDMGLLPREAELRGGERAEDPGAHRPGMVLHSFYAILRAVPDKLLGSS